MALEAGLKPHAVTFELVPAQVINELGAYGLPGRFAHWTRGKAYQSMKLRYDYGLHRIYELVVNTMPAQGFLLDSNSLCENTMVMAHVLGHVDFFANNVHFKGTADDVSTHVWAHAERVRHYTHAYGLEAVEAVLDGCLALESNSASERQPPDVGSQDLLGFLAEKAPLSDWERDLVYMVREEALYFRPQILTKIMNEGWASFWHLRLMRALELADDEYVDFAKLHASILVGAPLQINPYQLGLAVWEEIAGPDGGGLEEAFLVREVEDDVSFIRNHLSDQVMKRLGLFTYAKRGSEWVVEETTPEKVRGQLVAQLLHGGRPLIEIVDDDYSHGGLLLRHLDDGRPLDVRYALKTLELLERLWKHPVYLETCGQGHSEILSCDGSMARKMEE